MASRPAPTTGLTPASITTAFHLRGLQAQSDAVSLLVRQLQYELNPSAALGVVLDGITALLERSKCEREGGAGSVRGESAR